MTNTTMPSLSTPSTSLPTSLPPSSSPASSSSTPSTSSSSTPTTSSSSTPTTSSTPMSSSTPVVTSTGTPKQNTTTFTTAKTTIIVSGKNGGGITTKIITSTKAVTNAGHSAPAHSHKPATTSPASLVSSGSDSSSSSGLSDAGKVAIAVVIPVFVVALLIILGIFCWRKRKQKKVAEEARRKEIEDYGYNPNDDPTLPAVAAFGGSSHSPEMSEDVNGYRGWGNNSNAVASTNRKASTNLSSGVVVSDDGRGRSPGSPGRNTASDGGRSSDPLMGNMAAGVAGIGVAQSTSQGNGVAPAAGVARGPSNASSTYSATGQTENSDEGHNIPDYGYDNNYSQYAPYASGSAGYSDGQQPIIRDVTARRNTKIENPTVYPQQGNSGISQNF